VATVGAWFLGAGVPNTLTATVATAVSGNPVLFTASAATNIFITQQPPSNTASGANFTVTVQLRDANGTPSLVTGVPLSISLNGGGTLGGTTLVNTNLGVATFTVNITGPNGTRTLQITGASLTPATTNNVTIP
jgi:hypothetical protein